MSKNPSDPKNILIFDSGVKRRGCCFYIKSFKLLV